MARHRKDSPIEPTVLEPQNVRVLRGEAELAEASARAAEGAHRLRDRLEARAARDAWIAEHTEERVGWLRFARADGSAPRSGPLTGAVPAVPARRSPAA